MLVFVIALINFFAFTIGAICIGGDALSGHAEAGRYFLSDHGRLTETTQAVFMYSRLHAISVWITQPLGMIAVWYGGRTRKPA